MLTAQTLALKPCSVCFLKGESANFLWSSPPGVIMVVNGKKAINMVSTNFLGVAGDPKIQASINSAH